jgi:hypothetical protein
MKSCRKIIKMNAIKNLVQLVSCHYALMLDAAQFRENRDLMFMSVISTDNGLAIHGKMRIF